VVEAAPEAAVEVESEPVVEAAPVVEVEPEPVVEVEPAVEVEPEPVVEIEAEPVVEITPAPVAEVATEPVAVAAPVAPPVEVVLEPPLAATAPVPEVAPAQPWEVRAKARVERMTETALRHRRALITVCAVLIALVLLIAVPAVVRGRDTGRWERCVERTTGTALPPGGIVSRVVLEGCGPKPATNRLPSDRRN
jgi:hypothetical protein